MVVSASDKLEQEFAAWLGVRGAVATGFGRSALFLALREALPDGGDVLVPDFICAQVPEAVRRAGGRPVFYSVRRDLAVSAEDLKGALTPTTRGVLVAHYFGCVLPGMADLVEFCRARNLVLVEDCALALAAHHEGRPAGTFGDVAAFSFTKSDWCYGGGIVSTDSPARLDRLRDLRRRELRPAAGLLRCYGLLRRADFAANRPSLCRAATFTGRHLERLFSPRDHAHGNDFYDWGRFDAALPGFAARRASRILASHPRSVHTRRDILHRLTRELAARADLLFRPELAAGDNGAFLLLRCPAREADDWVEQADRNGVTLRRCWPALQRGPSRAASEVLAWFAARLVFLEIHPRWSEAEIATIQSTLRSLGENSRG